MGMPYSGKTTIGKLLAARLGETHIDLDEAIEQLEGQPIAQIFNTQGECVFRALESEVLERLNTSAGPVVSLGGGTPCFNDNMELISKGTGVYLQCTVTDIMCRIDNSYDRPLFMGKKGVELEQTIQDMLQQREPYYRQANIIIDTSGKTETEIIEEIVVALKDQSSK